MMLWLAEDLRNLKQSARKMVYSFANRRLKTSSCFLSKNLFF